MNINTLRAEYNINDSIRMVICFGSVVNFGYPTNPDRSAIVNAANNLCLGGGGVDGAISTAGGDRLLNDRRALPSIRGHGREVRCRTGDAVITGPNQYGRLLTPFVIHAVGPNYSVPKYRNDKKGRFKASQCIHEIIVACKTAWCGGHCLQPYFLWSVPWG